MNRAHLSDDRLIEICLAESFAPVDEPHLRTCERCESRRVELASTLADVSTLGSCNSSIISADPLA